MHVTSLAYDDHPPSFEQFLRSYTLSRINEENNGIAQPEVLAVDSRWMPGPSEYFELTDENFSAKRLDSGLLRPEWRARSSLYI